MRHLFCSHRVKHGLKCYFNLDLTMSEVALGNTLILSITPAGGDPAGKRTITFNSTFDAVGTHTIQFTNLTTLSQSNPM